MRKMLLGAAAALGLAACDGDSAGTAGPLVSNITANCPSRAQTWTQLAPADGRHPS